MQNEGFPCYKSHLDRLKVYVERSLNSNHLVLSYILPLIFQDLLMKRPATTTVILGQMGGGVMPMNAQNYAEEQLNLLQRKSTWLVEWFGCFNLFFLWFAMVFYGFTKIGFLCYSNFVLQVEIKSSEGYSISPPYVLDLYYLYFCPGP